MIDPSVGLWGLFSTSFLAATVLPGGSELALVGLLVVHPELRWVALLVATIGNTLGGMSSYLLARCVPEKTLEKLSQRSLRLTRQWGPPVLLLSWVPLIGDLLCAAAGWLRMPWLPCMLWMTLGKACRYVLLVFIVMSL